jgi:hypothetical protein
MCCIWLGTWNHDDLPRKCSLWMLYMNGRGDDSGQAHLLTFNEISGGRMKQLGISSLYKL